MQPARVSGLDVLRSLAVVLVVGYHLPHTNIVVRALTHFGWIGVDLFFVLSGYLIASQYLAEPARGEAPDTFRFYARRLMRTIPNYAIMLSVSVLLGDPLTEGLWRYLTFTQNFGVPSTFGVSWSLCIEEQFYLFFPAVVLLVLPRKHTGLWLAGGIVLAGALARAVIWWRYRPDLLPPDEAWGVYLGRLYYPTHTRLDGLTVGVLVASARRFQPAPWRAWQANANRLLFGGCALLVVALTVLVRQMGAASCVLGFPLLALGFGCLVVSATSPTSWLNRWRVPGAQGLALLSYALYLTHTHAIHLAGMLVPSGSILLCVALSLASAAALYWLVERPMLHLRDRWFTRSRKPSSASQSPALASPSLGHD